MSEAAKTEFDAKFNKAVALLHSFQYEDTRAAFEKIAGENPQCAMAEWALRCHISTDCGAAAISRADARP